LSAQYDDRISLARQRWLQAAAEVERCATRIARLLRAKYDPNQPRVPAGSSDGGRWTGNGGIENSREDNSGESDANERNVTESVPSVESILRLAPQLAATRASMNRCIDLCYRLLERFQPRGTININKWDFVRCLNACLGK
jgi:hypothetical protein